MLLAMTSTYNNIISVGPTTTQKISPRPASIGGFPCRPLPLSLFVVPLALLRQLSSVGCLCRSRDPIAEVWAWFCLRQVPSQLHHGGNRGKQPASGRARGRAGWKHNAAHRWGIHGSCLGRARRSAAAGATPLAGHQMQCSSLRFPQLLRHGVHGAAGCPGCLPGCAARATLLPRSQRSPARRRMARPGTPMDSTGAAGDIYG